MDLCIAKISFLNFHILQCRTSLHRVRDILHLFFFLIIGFFNNIFQDFIANRGTWANKQSHYHLLLFTYSLMIVINFKIILGVFCHKALTDMYTFYLSPLSWTKPLLSVTLIASFLPLTGPGTILNIHNCPLMSMLNGCQDDLAT